MVSQTMIAGSNLKYQPLAPVPPPILYANGTFVCSSICNKQQLLSSLVLDPTLQITFFTKRCPIMMVTFIHTVCFRLTAQSKC